MKAAVYAVNHIAQKNTNLPILNNILISAKDGVISLVSTNLEIGITSLLRGKIEKEGSFTVDARLFSDYVGLLNNEKVSAAVVDNELIIECGESKTKIRGLSAEEFPFIPVVDRSIQYTIPVEDLKKAVGQVIFAAAQDDSRAELSGVLFILRSKEMILAATDSYRLAEKQVPIIAADDEERRCIVPARTLQEVVRVLGADTGEEVAPKEVLFYLAENQCLFSIGNTEIVSRLIDGRYPDYRQIIPERYQCRLSVSRQDLSRAVKAAAIFSKAGVNDITLEISISKKTLSVMAASGQSGEHMSALAATASGEDTSITLNSRYLLDVLAVMTNEAAVLEIIDENAPCIVRDGERSDYLYIIMPIRK
mgnify:FL=1